MRTPNLIVAGAVLSLALPMSVIPTAQAKGVTFISFDDVPSACFFANTTALRDRYSAVKFSGPAKKDGGAVLDTCSSYGIEPRTGDRFLAFNSEQTLNGGGVPRGPSTMRLVHSPTSVEIWVSSGPSETAATFTLKGKIGNKTVQTASASVTAQGWTRLRVKTNKGFTSAVLSSSSSAWLADDLLLTD